MSLGSLCLQLLFPPNIPPVRLMNELACLHRAAGNVWDTFSARCAALNSTSVSVCGHTSSTQQPQEHPKQSWTQWAASSFSSFVNTAKDQLSSLAEALFLQQQPPRYLTTLSSPALRTAMLYGPGLPNPLQLYSMQQSLARAAGLQQEAFMLVQDAEMKELAAAQQMQAAKDLLSGIDSSSDDAEAVVEAQQLMDNAEEAHQAALELQDAAEELLHVAADEAAGVALAVRATSDPTNSITSSITGKASQAFYGPSMLGAIIGTISARPAGSKDAFVDVEYYYEEEPADSLDYDAIGYVYGDIESYNYDDEDRFGPSPPAGPAVAPLPTEFPSVLSPVQASLMTHLEDIHGGQAWVKGELLNWVSNDAFAGSRPLPPPGWAETQDQLHLYTDDNDDQPQYYYSDSDYESAGITYSSSIIMASALQDRMVKLAAQAVTASQQQPDGSSSRDDASAQEMSMDVSPLPLHMTVKREEEMLQLARFFDGLEEKLSKEAKVQLKDLEVSDPAVLGVKLVDGLPVLQMGAALAELLTEADASKLRSVLNAQMAELFADFVTLVSMACSQDLLQL